MRQLGSLVACAALTLQLSSAAFAQNAGADEAAAPPLFSDCEECPDMIELPTGKAMLGAEPYEANRKRGDMDLREVTFDYRLAVARTETTRGQYRAFMAETGHKMAEDGCNT